MERQQQQPAMQQQQQPLLQETFRVWCKNQISDYQVIEGIDA